MKDTIRNVARTKYSSHFYKEIITRAWIVERKKDDINEFMINLTF